MFERRIQKQLHEWAEKNNRKPLILRGARQVGKTTIVEQFGKEFDNFLSLNLEKKEAKDLFESTDDVKMLLPLLFCMIISRRDRDEPCFLSTRYSRRHKLLHCCGTFTRNCRSCMLLQQVLFWKICWTNMSRCL